MIHLCRKPYMNHAVRVSFEYFDSGTNHTVSGSERYQEMVLIRD